MVSLLSSWATLLSLYLCGACHTIRVYIAHHVCSYTPNGCLPTSAALGSGCAHSTLTPRSQITGHSPSPAPFSSTSITPLLPAPTMSSESPRFSGYSDVPVLEEGNFFEWKTALDEYLTPNNHVRVIRQTRSSTGALVDPLPPSDPDDLEGWKKSERVAKGVIMMTAANLHLELVYKYKGGSVWELWKAIETRHVPRDAFLYHQALMHLCSIRKRPNESYIDLYRRVDDARTQMDRAIPVSLTPEQLWDQLLFFRILTALPSDDPLRSLLFTLNINLDDLRVAFLRTDTYARVAAEAKAANAASVQRCHKCRHPGHLVKDCPQLEAVDRPFAHGVNASAGNRGRQRKGKRQSKRSE